MRQVMGSPGYTFPRKEKTLEFYIDRAIPTNLAHAFLQLKNGSTVEDFYREILIPMALRGESGDTLLKRAYLQTGVSAGDILLIACGYLTEAKAALTKGDRKTAWSAAMDAMAYCGQTRSASNYVIDLSGTVAEEVQRELTLMATRASEAKHRPYKAVEAEAVRIVLKMGQDGRTWDSATAAVTEIIDRLRTVASDNGMEFKAEDGGIKTIAGYLRKVPELGRYFLGTRGRPRKKI